MGSSPPLLYQLEPPLALNNEPAPLKELFVKSPTTRLVGSPETFPLGVQALRPLEVDADREPLVGTRDSSLLWRKARSTPTAQAGPRFSMGTSTMRIGTTSMSVYALGAERGVDDVALMHVVGRDEFAEVTVVAQGTASVSGIGQKNR